MPKFPIGPSIRERALKTTLERALGQRTAYLEKYEDTLTALQDRRAQDLSLDEVARQRRALAYYKANANLATDLVKQIRKQNADIAADRAANPLRPAARRQYDPAAILGLLERERRRTAPLSREAYARAQATAASRSRFDLKSAYRRSGTPFSASAAFKGEADFYDLRGVDVPTPSGVDPCVEYLRVQRNRREVMAARGLFRGYHTSHRRSPC